jgi:hypothetical protein
MTVEEMEAHAAYLDAFHNRLGQDMIAEATEELATERDPFEREQLIKLIERTRARMAS